MKIKLVQADLVWEQPQANLRNLSDLIEASGPADIIVLPEMFSTGFSMQASAFSESMDGPSVQWLLNLSLKTGSLCGGSLMIHENGKFYNRLIFADQGVVLFTYDKRHLFTMAGEDAVFTAGSKKEGFAYKGLNIRAAICYDLRFPVWLRNDDMYDLLIIPANWPEKRAAHWSSLLKARAIENQCFVAGVNRVGTDGKGHKYPGLTSLIGPSGEMLNQTEDGEYCFICDLDLSYLKEYRREFSFLQDADEFAIKKPLDYGHQD